MRLSTLFTASERKALQQAMLSDVLAGLSQARVLDGIAVISPDLSIDMIVHAHGARFIVEERSAGDLNRALAAGVSRLAADGAEVIVIISADVPAVDARDIERAVTASELADRMIVIPDRRHEGTNALVFRADKRPQFAFGPGSFRRHMLTSGQPAMAMELQSIAFDVDIPDDVLSLHLLTGNKAPETRAMITGAKDVGK